MGRKLTYLYNKETQHSNMKQSMTIGSEWKHILLFSLPIMAGNLLQQLYNTVDGIVVGNYVSQDALAAVGTCATLSMLFLAIAVGLSTGIGIMVAQYFGGGRINDLRRSVSTAIILNVACGTVFTVAGWFGAKLILSRLLGIDDPAILEMATSYFSIYCLGLIFQFVYNIVAAVLRAIGDSRATLYFLCVTAVINLILDLIFVIIFHWSVAGAAIATVIAQAICALVSIIYMFKKHDIFRFGRGEFVFDGEKCVTCLRLGIPGIIQHCVISFGHIFIQRLVNSFGPVSMAAYTVGNRMENYVLVPIFGLNAGVSTFAGQNMGAGKLDRIRKGLKATIVMSMIACIVVSILTYIFAAPLSSLFGVTGETELRAVEQIRFMAMIFVLFAFYMPFSGTLQGSGDVIFATACSLVTLATRVALAYALNYFLDVGYSSAWKAMPFGWALAIVMCLTRFFRGRWKEKGLVKHSEEETT